MKCEEIKIKYDQIIKELPKEYRDDKCRNTGGQMGYEEVLQSKKLIREYGYENELNEFKFTVLRIYCYIGTIPEIKRILDEIIEDVNELLEFNFLIKKLLEEAVSKKNGMTDGMLYISNEDYIKIEEILELDFEYALVVTKVNSSIHKLYKKNETI